MASKYAHLRGNVPVQQTERDEAVTKFMEEFRKEDTTTGAAAKRFNDLTAEKAKLTEQLNTLNQKLDAADYLMQDRLDADGSDAVSADGYTWSISCEPFPVCEDPEAIVKYLKRKKMADMLVLKTSELASRLRNLVKDEALNNELKVKVTTDAEGKEVREVRSNVPGVKVFLKQTLSRTKSSTGRSKA